MDQVFFKVLELSLMQEDAALGRLFSVAYESSSLELFNLRSISECLLERFADARTHPPSLSSQNKKANGSALILKICCPVRWILKKF